ncbi:acetylcholinesterase [Rhizodiscina lignyota]|uniref:Carboxylic ester hydrolase n=1 Tax=Rhizodiscina lignyota TaxID=1504668 RepID=A0A9P4MDX8_9PEZI|nr:acetylcholinesterase [Rhizodiscina lignyota]
MSLDPFSAYSMRGTGTARDVAKVVSGAVDARYTSVRQFLGIPYALSPVGDLRWEPPRANKLPSSVDANLLPRSCMQYLAAAPGVYRTEVLQFGIGGGDTSNIGEDCLTLSVWAPQQGENLPVLVFFYGGGLNTGGQDVPYQIPTQWVQRTKDLIVVVLNYRLNIFGFPNAPGLSQQNLGFLDQRLAVEWVRDNIKAFGGDPSKISIWGQSAGAESVDVYNFAWYQDPIVAGLIMDSGSAYLVGNKPSHPSNFTFVASQVGCGNKGGAAAQLSCMRKVDAGTLEQFLRNYADAGETPSLSFGAVPDGKIVFSNYTERALQGKVSRVPAIIGNNAQDGEPFAPYVPSGPNQTLALEAFLSTFFCHAVQTARNRVSAGQETYRFFYEGNFSNIATKPWLGAYHSAELPLLFGTHSNYRGASPPYEYAVSHAMQDAWRAFVNDPHGGLASQNWAQFTKSNDMVRKFGDHGIVAHNGDVKNFEAMCGPYFQ